MAGFLDKNNRIIDMVLTGEGKSLLSKGDLSFVYWAAFDDEVDYKPYIANYESYSNADLSASIQTYIEDTLVKEATTGYILTNKSGSDFTNVYQPLLTIPQGQEILPRIKIFISPTGSINAQQQKIINHNIEKDINGNIVQTIDADVGIKILNSQNTSIKIGFNKDGYPKQYVYEGFLVKILKSGSEGFDEIPHKYDLNNDISFGNELKLLEGKSSGIVK